MLYLIDGYNLLHQMGLLEGRAGPSGLERARSALLNRLRGALGADAASVTVVFDAAKARPGATEVHDYHGIRVRYAVHQEQADDLIELLIRQDGTPRQLTVVSDDHRVQKAGRRRHCTVLGCDAFLDWLEKRRQSGRKPGVERPGKPDGVSRADAQHWLREFADLENDPDFKEAFDPFDFDEPKGSGS